MVFGIQKVLDLTTPKNATCPSFHPSLYTFLPYFPPFPLWVYSQGHPLKSGFALKVDKLTLSKGRFRAHGYIVFQYKYTGLRVQRRRLVDLGWFGGLYECTGITMAFGFKHMQCRVMSRFERICCKGFGGLFWARGAHI